MNYPLISEYIEAIKSAEDNFEELSYLRPIFGEDGLPVMTSGNFAVVFKMKDEQSEKFYAVKCFTKEQEGRAEAYREIAKELKDVSSPYLTSVRYLEKELFVDTDQTTESEFPVLLMDWVEGKTLDKYLRENLDDKYALEMLAYRFSQLAQWLIPQPFAHGDLKPDNILVRENGTLVLVDYDGMYVPTMKGQKARELGSPDFRHPLRTEFDFDEHIDSYPIVSILLSLKAISCNPQLLNQYGAVDRLLLSDKDNRNIDNSVFLKTFFPSNNDDLNILYSLFILSYSIDSIVFSKHLLSLLHPNFCAPSRIKVTYNDVELNMVFVKGGKFLMGAQSENPSLPNYDEDAKLEEGPVRMIKVDDFWISEILVPMEMWPNCTDDMYYDEIIFERNRGKSDNLLYGAYGASYEECERFIDKISISTNLQFDFPTEEEWEYAARGGCQSKGFKYAGSDDIKEVAQYGTDIEGGLCALRQKKSNELGIYDMSGSLYEWCKGLFEINIIKDVDIDIIQSYLNEKYYTPEIRIHLKKGGSISSPADKCRITNREFDVECRSAVFEKPFEKVYLTHIVSQSVMYDDSIKKQYHDEHYWEEYYSGQNGLRLVLRTINSPWEQQCLLTTNKVDVDKFYIDEYGVKYSTDKKFLLEGPTEKTMIGGHIWKKGLLAISYYVQEGTKAICDRAFFDFRGMVSIKWPNSIEYIGDRAFFNCWSLSSVELNNGLISIGIEAFKNCKSLHSIHIPYSLKYIGEKCFDGSGLKIIFVDFGDKKRVVSMLPEYKDIIAELPF